MLRGLKNLVIFGLVARFLLPRWKRLASCLAVIVLAVYVEGEYVRFVQSMADESAPRGTVAWAILLKNLVVTLAVVAAILPDAWRKTRLHRKRTPKAQTPADVRSQPTSPAQPGSDTEPDDDPFAAVRDKPALRTRTAQIIERASETIDDRTRNHD